MEAGDVPHNIPEEASKLFYLANWTERVKASVLKYHYNIYDDDAHKDISL